MLNCYNIIAFIYYSKFVDAIQSTVQSTVDTTKQVSQTAVDYGKKAVDTTKGNICILNICILSLFRINIILLLD